MAQTDIYKNNERTQMPSEDPRLRKGRRRRSSSRRVFDEHDHHRRRSKNTGLRRLLHLFRKSENEKHFWWGLLIAVVVTLGVIAIWQFWFLGEVARKQSLRNEYALPQQNIPRVESTDGSASE